MDVDRAVSDAYAIGRKVFPEDTALELTPYLSFDDTAIQDALQYYARTYDTDLTPATYSISGAQPVLNTGSPSTKLYYNPDGGSYYHIDPNCTSLAAKYKPLKAYFMFPELNDASYKELKQCSECGAPLRIN